MRNPFRKHYDPYPDLMLAQKRLQQEVFDAEGEDINRSIERIRILSQFMADSVFYATVGKDRKKLTPAYVTDFERRVRDYWEMFA